MSSVRDRLGQLLDTPSPKRVEIWMYETGRPLILIALAVLTVLVSVASIRATVAFRTEYVLPWLWMTIGLAGSTMVYAYKIYPGFDSTVEEV